MAALTPYQRDIVIRTIYGEAAGEGYRGQVAVANVIKNRTASPQWNSDPAKVSLQKNQFSTWNKGKGGNKLARNMSADSAAYQRIGAIVDGVFAGDIGDPTGGATYYYAPRGMDKKGKAPGWWNDVGGNVVRIGNHYFRGGTGKPIPPRDIPNVTTDDDLVHGPRPQGSVPVLQKGKGKADPTWTKYVQKKISEAMPWLGLKVDGIYGPKTMAAVRAFQQVTGAKVDGKYGPQTDSFMQDYYPDPSESLMPGAVESAPLPRLPAMGDSLVDRPDPTNYPSVTSDPSVTSGAPRLPAFAGGALGALKTPGTDNIFSDSSVYRPVAGQQGLPSPGINRDIGAMASGINLAGGGAAAGAAGQPANPFQNPQPWGAVGDQSPTTLAARLTAMGAPGAPNAGGMLANAGAAAGLPPRSDQYLTPGDANGEAKFARFFSAHDRPPDLTAITPPAMASGNAPRLAKAGGAVGAMRDTDVNGLFKYIGALFGAASAKAADEDPSGAPVDSTKILANIKSATAPYVGGGSLFGGILNNAGAASRVVSTGTRGGSSSGYGLGVSLGSGSGASGVGAFSSVNSARSPGGTNPSSPTSNSSRAPSTPSSSSNRSKSTTSSSSSSSSNSSKSTSPSSSSTGGSRGR